MSDTVIKVEGLHKKFCKSLRRSMYYGTVDAAKSIIGLPIENVSLRSKEFWALQDVNFELKRGETLGLIGQNGCGKTTLLRLLNGLFPPDKGKITIHGRIGALIAVGAGFHPHMSGRENIFLNGTILGMTKAELRRKFDSIVDFAELADFIDAPVATYSSGMTIRLGFAIAIHCEPDILLIDEILAVGDISFVGKCFNKINSLQESGVATILVTHNIQNSLDFCKKGLLLNHGKQIVDTTIGLAIKEYETLLNIEKNNNEKSKHIEDTRISPVKSSCYIEDINGNQLSEATSKEPVVFCLKIHSEMELNNVFITLQILTTHGVGLIHIRNDVDKLGALKINEGDNVIKITIDSLNLEGGAYKCVFVLINNENSNPILNHAYLEPSLLVSGYKKNDNILLVNRKWQIN